MKQLLPSRFRRSSILWILLLLALVALPACRKSNEPLPVTELDEIYTIAVNGQTGMTALTANGLYYSANAGAQWLPTRILKPVAYDLPTVRIHYDYQQAAIGYALVDHQFYRSSDAGLTWRNVNTMPIDGFTLGLGSTLYAFDRDKVYYSRDVGLSWTPVASQPEPVQGEQATFHDIAVAPDDDRIVYVARAVTSNGGGSGIVYRSEDGGKTWKAVWNGQGTPLLLATDVVNPARLFLLATSGVVTSDDHGATWQAHKLPASDTPRALMTLSGRVWLSFDHSIWFSDDQGGTWQERTLPTGVSRVYQIARDLALPRDGVILATREGVFRSSDGGKQWTPSVAVLGSTVEVDQVEASATPGVAYSTSFSSLYRTTNGGDRWSATGNGLPAYKAITIKAGPHPDQLLYAALTLPDNSLKLYASDDTGTTWREQPLPSGTSAKDGMLLATSGTKAYIATGDLLVRSDHTVPLPMPGETARSLAVSDSDPQLLYLVKGQLWVSRDGGDHWQAATLPPDAGTPLLVTISGERLAVATNTTVLTSVDSGQSWTRGGKGLPGRLTPAALIDDPRCPAQLILAASGIYRSDDNGATWTQLPGPPTDPIHALAVDTATPQTLYIATTTQGIQRTQLSSCQTK